MAYQPGQYFSGTSGTSVTETVGGVTYTTTVQAGGQTITTGGGKAIIRTPEGKSIDVSEVVMGVQPPTPEVVEKVRQRVIRAGGTLYDPSRELRVSSFLVPPKEISPALGPTPEPVKRLPPSLKRELRQFAKEILIPTRGEIALAGAFGLATVATPGFPEEVIPAAALAARTAKRIKKAAKTGKRVLKAAKETRIGLFLKDLGFITAKGAVIVETAKEVGEVTLPAEQKKALAGIDLSKITGVGLEAEAKKLKEESLLKSLAFDISSLWISRKETFERAVREEFTRMGLTGPDLESAIEAAKRQRKVIGIGEATSLLEISRSVERIGRKYVTKQLAKKAREVPKKKAGFELFKITAPQIAQAGAIEGFGQEISQQLARERKLSLKESGIMGLFGAGTAGLLGGAIVGTKLGKPVVSKTLEISSFIADPFEKPGDILADVTEKIGKRITGIEPPRPVIFEITKPKEIVRIGVSKAKKAISKGDIIPPILTPPTPIPPIKKPGKRVIKAKGLEGIIAPVTIPTMDIPLSIPTPADIVTPPEITPPEVTPEVTPEITPVITPTEIPTFFQNLLTEITTTTPTPVTIFSPITIPTRTPILRIPPPIPLMFPVARAGTRVAKGKKPRFINELEEGMKLFRKSLGIAPPVRSRMKTGRSKKRK